MPGIAEIGVALCLGIALSACCGFRVFLPLLIASFAVKFGWMPVEWAAPWLGNWVAIISFAAAAVVEIAAYYIPVLDNFLDALAAPLAVGAGILITTSLLPQGDWEPLLRWTLGIIAGGGVAGTVHLGTGLLRLLSTKTTAGMGNGVLATGEHVAAGVGTLLSLLLPVLMAIFAVGMVVFIVYRLIVRKNR